MFDPRFVAVSAGCVVVQTVLVAATWRSVLGATGQRVDLATAYSIVYLAAVGRYLPGRVWALAGVALLAAQAGLSARATALASTATVALVLVTGVVMAAVGYASSSAGLPLTTTVAAWLAVPLAPAALAAALRLRLAPQLSRAQPFASALSWAAASWLPIALSQWAAARALGLLDPAVTPALLASSVVAWAASLAALPVPAGLGVREAVQALAVGGLMPPPLAAAFALLVRVALVAADLVAVLIAWWLRPASRIAVADAPLPDH